MRLWYGDGVIQADDPKLEGATFVAMPDTLDQIARKQIKRWIESTGTTQVEVGLQVGRNQSWMSRYLKGEFDADLDTLQKITRVFGHELTSALNIPSDPEEALLVSRFRALRIEARRIVLTLLEHLSRDTRPGRPPR